MGDGVVDQVGDHPLQKGRVGPHRQRRLVDVDDHVPGSRSEAGHRGGYHLVENGRAQSGGDGIGVDAGHVEEVVDQVGEAVGFVFDGSQELGHLGRRPVQVRLSQAVDRRLDTRQRSAQVVGDSLEEGATQLVGLLQGGGVSGAGVQIAAIEGHAVAGGMELALWCDLRVMASDAVMGIFCRRFGVPLIDMGTIRLPRLIGQSRAMDLILTGRPVEAEEALAIGLANRLAAPGKALEAALELAGTIAQFPQQCMRNDRRSVIEQWGLGNDDAILNETRLGMATLDSGESKAGAARFTAGTGRHGRFATD